MAAATKRKEARASKRGAKPTRKSFPRWLTLTGICCALATIVLIAYYNSLSNGFVWDDNRQVVMNPDLRSGAPIAHLFTSDVWGFKHSGQPAQTNYYRPLQMVTYRLTAAWFGFDPFSFHLLSMLFAIAGALAAFYVLLKLTPNTGLAFAATALFALHPMHSEAVDWISALSELGCAAFFLLAFGLFLSAREKPDTADRRSYFLFVSLSLVSFAAALFWKETAVVLPLLIAIYVLCTEKSPVRDRLRSAAKLSVPYWGVLLAYIALRFRVLGFVTTSQRNWTLTPVQAVITALTLVMRYWWKLIIPIPLNAYYVFSPVRSLASAQALGAILFFVILCAAVWFALRRSALAAFAAIWVFVTLLPVMNTYALGRNAFTERYLYLPALGVCLLMVLICHWALQRLDPQRRKPVSIAALVLVLIAFTVEITYRNPDWKDNATLFRKTLISSPQAPFVHYMVAVTETDDPSSAESHYEQAIALAQSETPPDRLDAAMSYEGLASSYADRGQFDQALGTMAKLRRLDPTYPEIDSEEGSILARAGRWQDAERVLRDTLARQPDDENALNALGLVTWQNKRDLNQAAALFTRALAVHSLNDDFRASVLNNLGGVYGDLQQFSQAADEFKSAVAIAPNDPEYHTNLATAFAAMGHVFEAGEQANAALRIDPGYAPARAVLQQLQSQ